MPEDDSLKSAYELAMERLRAQDREDGIEEDRPLSKEQKQEIARIRQEAKAKLAELEILHEDAVTAAGGDPEKLQKVEETYRIDRERVESRMESAIARVKRGRG
jgi:hypothetical protein